MPQTVLVANTGRPTGSAASRRLRAADTIPGVLYGHGMTPVSVSVGRRDLRLALSGAAGVNTVLDLTVDGTVYPAIVKDIQRHPVRRTVAHVDFIQVNLDETITVSVPLRLEGEAEAVAAGGGLVDPAVDSIEVTTTPRSIPDEFVVDVSDDADGHRHPPPGHPDALRRLRHRRPGEPGRHGPHDAGRGGRDRGARRRGRRGAGRGDRRSRRAAPEDAVEGEAALPRASPPPSEALDPVRLADRRTGEPGQGLRPDPAQRRGGGRRRAGPPAGRHHEGRARQRARGRVAVPAQPGRAGGGAGRAGLPADVHERLRVGGAGAVPPLRHRRPGPHRRSSTTSSTCRRRSCG